MQMPRLSLTTRIFLSSAGIVVVIMAVTLAVTQRSARRAAQTSIGRQLDATVDLVQKEIASERAQLANRAKIFAESPDYRSSIETAKEYSQYLDYSQTAQEQIGADWTQIISP